MQMQGNQENSDNPLSGRGGFIEVKDGQIIITDPQGFGKPAEIAPGDNVEITVNGQKIDAPTIVNNADKIEVKIPEISPVLQLDVEIPEDKMQAFLLIKKTPGQKYALVDSTPAQHLKVQPKPVAEEEPEIPGIEDVKGFLKQKGVVFGINEDAIREALNPPINGAKVLVAVGKDPYGVEDATVIYNFEDKSRQDEVRNPYSEGKIYSVSTGEIVARKKPPVHGMPGTAVTGHLVLPRKPEDVTVLIGEGVKLINDGQIAVATKAGRPVLEGRTRQYIKVCPVHVVEGDVDMNIGNIKFKGDIVVTGDVLDGFTLDAEGSIKVSGNVLHATLLANRDIVVNRNVITSKLYAGGAAVSYKRIYTILSQLMEKIEEILAAVKVMKHQKKFAEGEQQEAADGRLVQILIDYKYPDLPKLIENLNHAVQEMHNNVVSEVGQLAGLLNFKLRSLGPLRIKNTAEIDVLVQEVKKTLAIVEHLVFEPANVKVDYVQNSHIQASGDIVVSGRGTVTSYLEAGGKIVIRSGVVRGGKLVDKDKVIDYNKE